MNRKTFLSDGVRCCIIDRITFTDVRQALKTARGRQE